MPKSEFLSAYSVDPFGSLLLLPTPAMVRQTRKRMMDSGLGVASSSIVTLEGLALQILEDQGAGLTFLDEMESTVLLRQVLMEGCKDLPLLFREGQMREGFLHDLSTFLATCDDYGIGPEQLRGCGERGPQLSYVLERYRGKEAEIDGYGRSGLLALASHLIEGKRPHFSKCVSFGLYEPTPAQTSLLTALMKNCHDVHHFVPYLDDDKLFSRPRALGREGPIEVREPEEPLAAMSKLFLSDERVDLSSRVTLGCYRDQLEEVRNVAQGVQRLLSSGVPHERIAILMPMRRSLAPLMREVLADFEIEADMDTGMSLAESTVVQTVLDVLEVPCSDFHRERVVRMLSSPYLRFRPPGEEEAVSSYVIDRLSREASIVEGKENWSARFGSLVHRLQEEAASPDVPDWRRHQFERKVQEVERASKNLEPLLERLSSLDWSVRWATMCGRSVRP